MTRSTGYRAANRRASAPAGDGARASSTPRAPASSTSRARTSRTRSRRSSRPTPTNEKGEPHILEHCVLNGSKRYPDAKSRRADPRDRRRRVDGLGLHLVLPLEPVAPGLPEARRRALRLALRAELLAHETFLHQAHHLEFTDPNDPTTPLLVPRRDLQRAEGHPRPSRRDRMVRDVPRAVPRTPVLARARRHAAGRPDDHVGAAQGLPRAPLPPVQRVLPVVGRRPARRSSDDAGRGARRASRSVPSNRSRSRDPPRLDAPVRYHGTHADRRRKTTRRERTSVLVAWVCAPTPTDSVRVAAARPARRDPARHADVTDPGGARRVGPRQRRVRDVRPVRRPLPPPHVRDRTRRRRSGATPKRSSGRLDVVRTLAATASRRRRRRRTQPHRVQAAHAHRTPGQRGQPDELLARPREHAVALRRRSARRREDRRRARAARARTRGRNARSRTRLHAVVRRQPAPRARGHRAGSGRRRPVRDRGARDARRDRGVDVGRREAGRSSTRHGARRVPREARSAAPAPPDPEKLQVGAQGSAGAARARGRRASTSRRSRRGRTASRTSISSPTSDRSAGRAVGLRQSVCTSAVVRGSDGRRRPRQRR